MRITKLTFILLIALVACGKKQELSTISLAIKLEQGATYKKQNDDRILHFKVKVENKGNTPVDLSFCNFYYRLLKANNEPLEEKIYVSGYGMITEGLHKEKLTKDDGPFDLPLHSIKVPTGIFSKIKYVEFYVEYLDTKVATIRKNPTFTEHK